ncbi:hypothetical protein DMY87_21025 [Rhizobium wuzhouense]|uniref:MlaB-like STAS domain-containing protein n=2 Tax=Rhizobium/Agrobacterium group TaxID=227290 RepID=A0ABX5NL68_9HYPH|nr:hypothetical protein DMY87_21025 [Rhizobium wuzhouense]
MQWCAFRPRLRRRVRSQMAPHPPALRKDQHIGNSSMTEDLTTLRLEGALTIKTAAETRDRLLAAFQSAKTDRRPLEIEIAEDCDCDLTLPQLLLSAKATAAKDGIDLRIRADARGRFSTTLERAGLSAAVEGGSLVTMNGDQR